MFSNHAAAVHPFSCGDSFVLLDQHCYELAAAFFVLGQQSASYWNATLKCTVVHLGEDAQQAKQYGFSCFYIKNDAVYTACEHQQVRF